MTNWPNIQEYRNFEAKFFDDLKQVNISNSTEEYENESVSKNKNDSDEWMNWQKNADSKIVRCVIKNDFDESFKKFDRGDGLSVSNESVRPKIRETTVPEQSVADKIRLQNHLKWKKQKEEEYLQKKEAERILLEKKKEEEIRKENIKKQKELEREKKVREWQEQKAREKERKKREKLVMTILQEQLKTTTPTIDKEKLIENWVRLKDKQKQMEVEKKAEILKREEESKALRQTLAALSYQQWKERVKGRMVMLPKNGYQIFGPKPEPVVKEDWNHNFTSNSPRHSSIGVRNSKSNTSTYLTFRSTAKESENFSKDAFYLGNLKEKTPSFYHLKRAKSGFSLCNGNENKMPLKELQPDTLRFKKNQTWKTESLERLLLFYNQKMGSASQLNSIPNKCFDVINSHKNQFSTDTLTPLYLLIGEQCDQTRPDHIASNPTLKKKFKQLKEQSEINILPNKKRLDLYINSPSKDNPTKKCKKNSNANLIVQDSKKMTEETKNVERKITKKCPSSTDNKFTSSRMSLESKCTEKCLDNKVQKTNTGHIFPKTPTKKDKNSRRSRSCDKPVKNTFKNQLSYKGCSSSRSAVKITNGENKGTNHQKKKLKKQVKPSSAGSVKKDKTNLEIEVKSKKKNKRNNNGLAKSYSFSDSPYFVKRTVSKNLSKISNGHKKYFKDSQTKSDDCTRGQLKKVIRK